MNTKPDYEDCFNWDVDTIVTQCEQYLKVEKRDYISFTAKHSDKWNIFDIEETLEGEHYAYTFLPEAKKFYVALDNKHLALALK